MKIRSVFTIIVCFLFVGFGQIKAQENDHKKSSEKEHLKNPGLEMVLSSLFIYNSESENLNPATELHITYWTTHKWAFGVGYSMVFEENKKIGHELAVLVSHKP